LEAFVSGKERFRRNYWIDGKYMINRIFHFYKKGNQRTINVKKNMTFSFLLKVYSIIINIIYLPLLVNHLEKEIYGIWVTIVSIVFWSNLLDLGFGNGLKNKLGESLALKNYTKAKEQVSTTYFYLSLIFSFVLILLLMSNYFLNWNKILNTNVLSNYKLQLLCSIVICALCVRFVFQLINTVLVADQKAFFPNFSEAISNTLSLIALTILLLLNNHSVILFALIISFIPVFTLLLLNFYFYNGKYHYLKPSFQWVKKEQFKDILSLSWKFFFIQISIVLISSVTNLLISHYLGPSYIPLYDFTFKLFNFVILPYSIAFQAIFPSYVNAFSLSDNHWIKRSVKIQISTIFLSLLPIAFLAFYAKSIISFWSMGKVSINNNLLVIFMAIYAFVIIWNNSFGVILGALSKIRLSMILTIISATLNIPISIFLLNKGYGLISILIGILCSSLLIFIFNPIQSYYFVFVKNRNKFLDSFFS
jgi:O-antigen/teichoic acid export membrane protein